MDNKTLDTKVKKFVDDVGRNECKKAGLGAMMKAFYCGLRLSECSRRSSDEIANDLGLSTREFYYWEDLYYKKDSWFNKD